MNNNEILAGVFSLKYIKQLSIKDLGSVAKRIRDAMIEILLQEGGHFSSNLGTIELTLALHYVFNSPDDKLIFDVGHQCYTHKILTGRGNGFDTIRQWGGLSGFTRPQESEHDIIATGHASVSLSVAAGLVAGQDATVRKEDRVIAIIGDAGLSGGMAFEALNHIGALGLPVIIILNDNQMSIAPGCGALHEHLAMLDDSNFFTTLGFTYWGAYDGHDCTQLVDLFQRAKEIQKPLIIHVKTQKGKGYEPSELNPIAYHGIVGSRHTSGKGAMSYTQVFSHALVDLAKEQDSVVAITAAMPNGTGVDALEQVMPHRCFDVGIAEQHAVTFASGLALAGKMPIVALYSTFVQRAMDQIIHDVVMQSLGMIITLDRAGVVAGDGESHQGLYDIALLQSLPNTVIMAPASAAELRLMLFWASKQKALVVIRYPKATIPDESLLLEPLPISLGEGQFWKEYQEADLLIVSLGAMSAEAYGAMTLLLKKGIHADLYNARFALPLNTQVWEPILSRYQFVITIEEGVLHGGWGVQLSRLAEHINFHHIGVEDPLLPQGTRSQLLHHVRLDSQSLAERIENVYLAWLEARKLLCKSEVFSSGI